MSMQDDAEPSANDTGTVSNIDAGLTQPPFPEGSMEIALSSGHKVLVDIADYGLLSNYSWYLNKAAGQTQRCYAAARVRGTGERIRMHRLLMDAPAGMVVHHKNNNGLDNRRCNLEVTTNRKNTKYAFAGKQTGVHFDKKTGRYRVAIRASLGTYFDEPTARVVAKHLNEILEAGLEEIESFIRHSRSQANE